MLVLNTIPQMQKAILDLELRLAKLEAAQKVPTSAKETEAAVTEPRRRGRPPLFGGMSQSAGDGS